MNTNPYDTHRPRDAAQPPQEAAETSERAGTFDRAGAPEAIEASATTDRRRTRVTGDDAAKARARGVDWIRPTDLIAHDSGAMTGRGLDLQKELSKRARARIADGGRWVGQQARRLPPLSSFGHGARHQPPTRSAVGRS